ncbi:MAG: site-specific integrase [Acidobacteriota bacterium]
MSNLDPLTVATPQRSHQEMLRDHKQILQNYFDAFITRGLSPRTIEVQQRFVEHWFEKIRVFDVNGERQIFLWEVMNRFEGRLRIKEFLMTLSTVDEDGQPCLRATTVRAYASFLERLFVRTLNAPYITGIETISSKYGPIENPFTGVEYPVHSRDLLRSERFFVTQEQILKLLVFLREVYPGLINKNLTVARLYAVVMLITETGMRSIEVLNLNALGDDRDIFYSKKVIQTRFGKGHNSSGAQTRVIPLTHRSQITLMEYERVVRPQFRNQSNEPSLFLTLKGTRLSYGTLRDGFSRLIVAARNHGVDLPPKLTIHDLRASFATNFLEENPEKFWRLMELLGHVSPSSTCLYIRSRGDNRVGAMKQARKSHAGSGGMTTRVYNT